ncbi:MAG: rhomboid family intramembrane serine protease [Acidobacteriota bacterium]
MIPLRDTIRSRRRPYVVYAILGINLIVFLFELSLGTRALDSFTQAFGFVPERFFFWVRYGGMALSPFRFLPLVSALFIHGGWLHLGGNMLYLWVFADNVEDRLGHAGFAVFYLICGVAANCIFGLTALHSTVPLIGASGAIAGVLGAYLILFPKSRILTLIPIFIFPLFLRIPAFAFLGIWFVLQLFTGAWALTARIGQTVAWWAHVGGFLSGVLLLPVMIRFGPRGATGTPEMVGPQRTILLPRDAWQVIHEHRNPIQGDTAGRDEGE